MRFDFFTNLVLSVTVLKFNSKAGTRILHALRESYEFSSHLRQVAFGCRFHVAKLPPEVNDRSPQLQQPIVIVSVVVIERLHMRTI
jgi:hypothetical protein